MASLAEQIEREVMGWADVTAAPHRFGGTEFRVNHREIGHLHGSWQADVAFSVKIREQLIAQGRADYHHILPETGWVTYRIRSEADVPRVVYLFRLSYELITGKVGEARRELEETL